MIFTLSPHTVILRKLTMRRRFAAKTNTHSRKVGHSNVSENLLVRKSGIDWLIHWLIQYRRSEPCWEFEMSTNAVTGWRSVGFVYSGFTRSRTTREHNRLQHAEDCTSQLSRYYVTCIAGLHHITADTLNHTQLHTAPPYIKSLDIHLWNCDVFPVELR